MVATGILVLLAALFLLSVHAVDNDLTPEDLAYLPLYEQSLPAAPTKSDFEAEVFYIKAVQALVLNIAPRHQGLPFNTTRDLKSVFVAGAGYCYDRSRVIEKLLRRAGMRTRHVALYSTAVTGSSLKSLMTPGVLSHAVSEVLTSRGWLVVDSNAPWLSLDTAGRPISIASLSKTVARDGDVAWSVPTPNSIYDRSFVAVYGLYSRHGRFYPPYNFIPDIHYGEFAQNFW